MFLKRIASRLVLVTAFVSASAVLANVKDGVDAWSRGDYAAAVAEWEGPASRGDADAQYNLAQAYRLGRGVPQDSARAEELYATAAAAGHLQAADNYGLMLFQGGRRQEALPYVTAAAERGDPRAQYLLGIAQFNGDIVEKDWVHAYALLTLANAQGLPQAPSAIAQMDQYIPLEQREEAVRLAGKLQFEADARRAQQLTAADLRSSKAASPALLSQPTGSAPASAKVPQAIATVPVPASVAAGRTAVTEAGHATGAESPAGAGADYARPSVATPSPWPSSPASRPDTRPGETPAPRPAATSVAGAGPWRVQLGAFGVPGNADRLWQKLSGHEVLAGTVKVLVPAGRVTKLQAGGFRSRASAESACAALKREGQDCLVVAP